VRRAVGIDAGGTKVAAGLVDRATGAVLERKEVPSAPERGADAVLADCVRLAEALGAGAGTPVGLGIPELVAIDGRVASTANWDWRGRDVAAAFAGVAPAAVESDVRAAARAEARFGAGRRLSSFLYVTVGTGISQALVLDGEPWPGARGNAIVLGAPPVEEVASGPALARAAGAPDARAALADEAAVAAAAAALGREVARLVNALDPAAIVVGGGLGLVPAYRRAWVAAMRELVYADETRSVPVIAAELGLDAGVVGAALAAP
jgi:glucokinase